MIVLILLFIITILILILIKKNIIEGFEDYNPKLMGHEEGLPHEYRKLDYPKFKYPMWNTHEYMGNNWHLRFPYMVNQRYSYDDVPEKCKQYPTFYDYAILGELPLDFKDYYSNMRCPKCKIQDDSMLDNKKIYGFNYNTMNDITTNTGDPTPDDYYYRDRLQNNVY